MADRKVYVTVTTKLVLRVDEGVEVSEIMNEMDYSFKDTTGKATVEDSSMEDFEITNSK